MTMFFRKWWLTRSDTRGFDTMALLFHGPHSSSHSFSLSVVQSLGSSLLRSMSSAKVVLDRLTLLPTPKTLATIAIEIQNLQAQLEETRQKHGCLSASRKFAMLRRMGERGLTSSLVLDTRL